ncbi:hypothetical protein [Blastococcus montanus]|uniref:hypothetical protein n=1 Tax=Blastococcus montanus TaxID=3144973 RepID=UPI003209E290
MTSSDLPSLLGRGILAGVAGTVVMTAFQKLVEMPLTGRSDSYAPAELAERFLPVRPSTREVRAALNYAAHLSLGGLWGTAYGVAARCGLRGQRAVNAVFAVVYPADVAMSTALGVYSPSIWTVGEWAVDVVDKYLQAQATGLVFDRFLDPA